MPARRSHPVSRCALALAIALQGVTACSGADELPATADEFLTAVADRYCVATEACGCGDVAHDDCVLVTRASFMSAYADSRSEYVRDRAAAYLRDWDDARTTCAFPITQPPLRGLVASGGACSFDWHCEPGLFCERGTNVCAVGSAPPLNNVMICD